MFANALMLPHFDYLDSIWSWTYKKRLGELDIMYKKVAKIALDVSTIERDQSRCTKTWVGFLSIWDDRFPLAHICIVLSMKPVQSILLGNLCILYISVGSRNAEITENCNLYTPKSRSHKEFNYLGDKAWNILPISLRECDSVKKPIYQNIYNIKSHS
jgi:hypothetical protein